MREVAQFETDILDALARILGPEAPSREDLLHPRWKGRGRGRRFVGLTRPQREEAWWTGKHDLSPLIRLGVFLMAEYHLMTETKVFKGTFAEFVAGFLHEHIRPNNAAAQIAVMYGLDPQKVAKLAEIFRGRRRQPVREKLWRAFKDGTADRLIAWYEGGEALRARYPALRERV